MKQEMDVTASGLVDDPPRRRRKPFLLRRKVQRRVLPWVVIILLFAMWEIVVRLFDIEQFLLPAPSAIFAAGWQWRWPIQCRSRSCSRPEVAAFFSGAIPVPDSGGPVTEA